MLWLLLFVLFGACAFWHIRENNQLADRWHKEFGSAPAERLTQFAWSRSFQLLAVILCAIFIIIGYDWRLQEANDQLSQSVPPLQISEPEPPAAVAQPEPPASVAVPEPQTSPNDTPSVPASNGIGISDLYNSVEPADDKQAAMDGLKKRYEGILVTFFFLKKCGQVEPADYHVILSALSQEMASVNAPGRLQHDTLTAAQGSYHEMYERSSCDDGNVAALKAQYKNYIDTLTRQYAVP